MFAKKNLVAAAALLAIVATTAPAIVVVPVIVVQGKRLPQSGLAGHTARSRMTPSRPCTCRSRCPKLPSHHPSTQPVHCNVGARPDRH